MATTSPVRVFDHDSGSLQAICEKLNFVKLVTTKTGNAKDAEAKDLLLADPNWKIALLHILDEPWEALCRSASRDRVLVRFSNEKFPPTPPKDEQALCLHCTRKISELTQDDIEQLKTVLENEKLCVGLRNRLIPENISHLVSFEEPHNLRALHILLQGVLASWAANPEYKKVNEEARNILGVSVLPPMPSQQIDSLGTIWRGLGLTTATRVTNASAMSFRENVERELGVERITQKDEIAKLVESIFNGTERDRLDPDKVLVGFKALDDHLKKQ